MTFIFILLIFCVCVASLTMKRNQSCKVYVVDALGSNLVDDVSVAGVEVLVGNVAVRSTFQAHDRSTTTNNNIDG